MAYLRQFDGMLVGKNGHGAGCPQRTYACHQRFQYNSRGLIQASVSFASNVS